MDQQDKLKNNKYSEDKTIIIAESGRPIWQLVIASIFYSILFFIIYLIGSKFYTYGFNSLTYEYSLHLFSITSYFFVSALGFSSKSIYYFDLDKKWFKKEISVAFFRFGKWKGLLKLEYISVLIMKEHIK